MLRRPILFLTLLLTGFASPAFAQMADVEPYPARVVVDQAEVRCGWGSDGWYAVGRAPRGTVLTVDGQEGEWRRVRYPDELDFGVLLRASEVEIDEEAGTVTLLRPARPILRNRQSPVEGSWMKMTGEPFPPGTTFDLLETLESQGAVTMVRIKAPDRVRGYVLASDIEPIRPEPSETAESQTAPEVAGEQPSPGAAPPEPAAEELEIDTAPLDAVTGDEADEEAAPEPAGETVAQEPEQPAEPSAEQLVAAYQAVVEQPIETAELEPLIAEYRRALARAPEDPTMTRKLGDRLQLLELRRDLQQDLRAVETAADRAAREREAIDMLVIDWRSRPAYTTVGRLMASALYDGRRLPLMYRLQSLDGPGGRTIAYLMPDEELDLQSKLGAVVGVLGDPRRDPTINVRIIDPDRVDVLQPGR